MSFGQSLSNRKIGRVLAAWLLGGGAAFFMTGFLVNFYPAPHQFILLVISLTVLSSAAAYWILDLRLDWRANLSGLLTLLLVLSLAIGVIIIATRFPGLFDSRLFLMETSRLPLFSGLVFLSLPLTFLLVRGISPSRTGCLRANLPGLLLATGFFVTYFTLASTLNFPGYRTLDQFFDTDISAWLARLQVASPQEITDEVRAVHPAVLLFLRPLVWGISLLLNGDRLHAIFILHALAASLCVFLMWRIVRRASGNVSYALLMASLLGASASHLLLGSMLETYIYSALGLLFFFSLLQERPIPFGPTVLAGVFVFGITVTNLAQTIILYFLGHPRLKVILRYVLLVLVVVFVLNALQAWIYPAADALAPSSLRAEQKYQFDFLKAPWHLTGRIQLTARALLLYGILAPTPFILTQELGVDVPNFRTFEVTIGEFHVAGYTGLADIAAKLWMLFLVVALVLFLLEWFRNSKPLLALGLLMCLGFNFALHLLYGDDPMLYSPDWVYALVLFVSLSFTRFASRRSFQLALLVFIALTMAVNLSLLQQIMEASAPFYGR